MSRDIIGPALPPGFRSANEEDDREEEVAGPVLPPGYKYSHSSDSSEDGEKETSSSHRHNKRQSTGKDRNDSKNRKIGKTSEEDEDDFFGPALPPGYKKQSDSPDRPVIGPALPPGFKKPDSDTEDDSHSNGSADTKYKSEDSEEEEDDDDEEIVGPLPAKGPIQSTVAQDIEHRAWKMKQKLAANDVSSDGPINPSRETWMTELPPELTNFGLGPRTFKRRTNEKTGDRSEWTDTPGDKERKAREKQEGKVSSNKGEEKPQVSERDRRLADKVSTYNDTKRSESLLDLHRKKLKRKAEDDKDKTKERQPFDREQDLQVNRFDDAQKKALLRKSQELNTKFSHGGGSMFL
ncbi:PREDICTED: GPALPP motifs-containing protein 1 [Nanorana parkeri]|uniref:GPALPP motifs-containing protein 1 n=1 Tax=Nanorana parkeri TaxID=125878 RepID=UPI0008541B42|nr:PREDICTED: GPALPP motifs-containing protein 1 [Nanorana parkeri]